MKSLTLTVVTLHRQDEHKNSTFCSQKISAFWYEPQNRQRLFPYTILYELISVYSRDGVFTTRCEMNLQLKFRLNFVFKGKMQFKCFLGVLSNFMCS